MEASEPDFVLASAADIEHTVELIPQEEYISLDPVEEETVPHHDLPPTGNPGPNPPHDSHISDENGGFVPLELHNLTHSFSDRDPDSMRNSPYEVKPMPDANPDTSFLGGNISAGDASFQGCGDASAALSDSVEMSLDSNYDVKADDDTVSEFPNACSERASELVIFNAVASSDSYYNGSFGFRASQMNSTVMTEDSIVNIQAAEHIAQDNIVGNGEGGVSAVKGEEKNRRRLHSSSSSNTPSVRVIYNCLTRESKDKLIGILNLWAEWHRDFVANTENYDSSFLESGDETFFPALQIGMDRKSMSFWMDKPSKNGQLELGVDSTPVMHSRERDAPLYDRAAIGALVSEDTKSYMEGNLEFIDECNRCFNCGSYSHSLRECPRPRDNVAIYNARRVYSGNRGSAIGQRTPSRYYHLSSGGKFDNLKPGVLGAETRQMLGIGELDPPPWLNRMRELGYPPGYLEDQEEESSGITIFGADEDGPDGVYVGEDGEIIEEQTLKEPRKKMAVEFPGLNAPIPQDADMRSWDSPADFSRHQSYSKNKDWDGSSGNTRESHHKRSRVHSPRRSSSDNMRSPMAFHDEFPPLGAYHRHSPKHNLWPYQSPSTPIQRSPYDHDYGDERHEAKRQAWVNAQEALQSLHKNRDSPSRRRR